MDVLRIALYMALVALTGYLAYRIQRNEREQRLKTIWLWPALFVILAVHGVMNNWNDPGLWPWLYGAIPLGIVIGTLRGLNFKITPGEKPGTFRLMATPVTAALYLGAIFFNEYHQVFRTGDANVARLSCALLVMTAFNSITVNTVKVIRYRRALASGAKPQR